MGVDRVSLRLEADGSNGVYGFTCPECSLEVNKPASRKTVALLIAAGVEPVETSFEAIEAELGAYEAELAVLPAEDRSPLPEAPAFTLDDVITFHFLLEDGSALDALVA